MKYVLSVVLVTILSGQCRADTVSHIYTLKNQWLYSLCFKDDSNGYFLTDSSPSMIYTTNDGGGTWQGRKFGMHSRHTTCIKGGKIGYAVGSSWKVLFTEDGWKTWKEVDTNLPNLLKDVGIQKIYFINAAEGYVVGGNPGFILKTLDGGRTWNKQIYEIPDFIYDISFSVDGKTGYVAGDSGVFKTIDSGKHWEQVLSVACRSICFPKNTDIGYATNGGDIFKTVDAGKTWEKVFHFEFGVYEIYFFNDEKTGYAIGDYTGEESAESYIMKTLDGGHTWSRVPLGKDNDGLRNIVFPSKKVGYAADAYGNVYKIIRSTGDININIKGVK